MKKSVVIFITAVCLLITGCGDTGSLSKLPSSSFHEDKQKLTIMHIDADNKRFQDFIEETEKKLDMEITVEKCPSNADNRQAKISTILASGDKNIDLINDFVLKSNYRQFYKDHKDFYDKIVSNYKEYYLLEVLIAVEQLPKNLIQKSYLVLNSTK